jgi:HAD superfamily hydrolase (TIGR01509 family)
MLRTIVQHKSVPHLRANARYRPTMDAVVFDLDGTLVDSEPLSDVAWRTVLAQHGHTASDPELQAVHGLRFPEVHAHFAQRVLLPSVETVWDDYARLLFSAIDDHLVVFADAVAAAEKLHASGVALALVTSSSRERLERTIEAAQLRPIFGATVAGDEVARGKPAPDGYIAAARMLDVDPGRCVAVEDSQAGIDAARAAGMKVLAVARLNLNDALSDADLVVTEVDAASIVALLTPAPGLTPAAPLND